MITYVELMVFIVYAAMAGYIMYLQHQLKKSNQAGALLTMLIHDMVQGDVEIERTDDGIRVKHKGKPA